MKIYGLFETGYAVGDSVLLGLYYNPEDAEEDMIKSIDGELTPLEVKGKDKAFEAFKESSRETISKQAERIAELLTEINKLKKENKQLLDQYLETMTKVGI